jgi:ectoine hydroxylase-related dioxygenase (phytanoyl-CoA dioxygenase family)
MHSTTPLADLRSGRFLLHELPQPVKKLSFLPTLVRRVRRILGDNVALYHARVLIKDGHFKEAVHPHQDSPYSHGLYNKLHVYLPLTPNKRSNGCLQFWANSHKYGLIGQGDIDPAQFEAIEIVSEEVFPGDVVLMDYATWHFSERATTDEERFLHQLVYQPSNDGSYVLTPELISGEWLTQLRCPASKALIYRRIEEREALSQRVAELEQEVKRLQAERASVPHGPSAGPQ